MTTITDEHGRVILRNTYDNGQVVRQEYAGGQVLQYEYQLSPDQVYVEKALITLPDHSLIEVKVDGVPEGVRANPSS